MWRKQGGAEALQKSVVASQAAPQPTNGNQAPAVQNDAKSKRLNPIRRKQMEDRLGEVEQEISHLETAIATCETALQAFVSAEETQRLTKNSLIAKPTCKLDWPNGKSWARTRSLNWTIFQSYRFFRNLRYP